MKKSLSLPWLISLSASFLLLLSLQLFSCSNNPTANENQAAIDSIIQKASNFFMPIDGIVEHPDNPMSEAKILLGQTLYYDVRLSKNNTQSCNTCHNLETFGVDNLATSLGDLGKNGDRNSPTVLNASLHSKQFWDGRAQDVEEQAGGPILNPVEMNMPSEHFVVDRLKNIKGYHDLFAAAFPDEKDPIQYSNITKAIGAFERTLITPSKFDDFLKGDKNALSPEERKGLITFIDAGCTTCHNGIAVGGSIFQKFPLYGDEYMSFTGSTREDRGMMEVSQKESDKFIFKTPSLRNIAHTGPYFHDGSVSDLYKAVEIMGKLQINKDLSKDEIHSIVTFLHALTGEVPANAKRMPPMPQ